LLLGYNVFDLRTSPFYLLGVSPRDNRAIIAQAMETAIAEGTLDETAATRARFDQNTGEAGFSE
jgi:hypothetical protein